MWVILDDSFLTTFCNPQNIESRCTSVSFFLRRVSQDVQTNTQVAGHTSAQFPVTKQEVVIAGAQNLTPPPEIGGPFQQGSAASTAEQQGRCTVCCLSWSRTQRAARLPFLYLILDLNSQVARTPEVSCPVVPHFWSTEQMADLAVCAETLVWWVGHGTRKWIIPFSCCGCNVFLLFFHHNGQTDLLPQGYRFH